MRAPSAEAIEPPRLARAAGLQALALLVAAFILERPWSKVRPREPEPRPPPPKETRIRVVQLPKQKPPPPKIEPRVAEKPPSPKAEPPRLAQPAPARPAPAQPAPPPPQPARPMAAPARTVIAADSSAVQGVRLRVLVPRDPWELAGHLRGSGGCLVVSRLSGGSAEVLSVLTLDGTRAVETQGPPCNGAPRLVRDAALNAALGDPLGRVRAALPPQERGGELALQVLLSPALHADAQMALRARFGALPMEEIARQAAAAGYELTCFAEPSGALRCE